MAKGSKINISPALVLLNVVAFLCFAVPGLAGKVDFRNVDVGDGKPATEVILTLIDGITTDSDGNVYIAHRSKNRIRKIDRNGIITTIAGNGEAGFSGDKGPAREAALNFPAGLCIDPKGNLYIADRNNHRVRKVDPSGIITTFAGNGTKDFSGDDEPAVKASLNYPSDVACAKDGSVFISDRSNNRIRKVDTMGIIITYAGMGPEGFGGDFGPAEDAFLKFPFGIALDNQGNLYIADRGNNRVRKVDTGGTITTIAGNGTHSFGGDYGPASKSSLAYPTGVAADANGNVYIADRNNNRIRKVDRIGIITTVMGTGESEYNGENEIASETNIYLPLAVDVDSDNRLLVVDRSHFRVRSVGLKKHSVTTIAGNGKFLFRGDGGPGRGATLDAPSGIAIDKKGNIIFSDKQNNRLRLLQPNGIINTFAGTGFLGNEGDGGPASKAALFLPSEIAIDKEGNLYLISQLGRSWAVRKIDSKGTIRFFAGNGIQGNSGDGGPAVKASFLTLKDVVVDKAGNVYLADPINKNIRKIDKNGIISTVAGENWKRIKDEEPHPNGLAVDKDGSIYVSDSGSSKIRKIDKHGVITTFAGTGDFKDFGDGGPALKAGIRSPGGLVIAPNGDLYVAEETSHRIRRINSEGIVLAVAGTGVSGFSGDGGPAIKARLKSPYRMVFDKEGNLFFTDRDNNRIRKIDKNGIISTVAGNENIGWMQDGLEVRITVHNFP